MKTTRRWLLYAAGTVFTLSLLLGSALLTQSSTVVAAIPGTMPDATPQTPGVDPRHLLADPDLRVESVTFAPSNPGVGESVNITVTVRNQGDASASGFYVYLFVDPETQPPDEMTAYTTRCGYFLSLPPGGVFQCTRTDHTFESDGTYPIYAWVDRDGYVAESDEGNNLSGPVNIPVGSSCAPDLYEGDDLCSEANAIATDGTDQQHNLCGAPDHDWVKFDATSGISYRIQAIADGADAELEVELHGTCNGPPSFGGGADFHFTPPDSGTYYLKVSHTATSYGLDTDYRLRVTPQNTCNAAHEPNNLCSVAGDITVDGDAQAHSFCEEGDADWSVFPVQAGSTYVVSATNVGASADVQLSVHANCSAPPSFGSGQRVEFTAPFGGFVYVKAENTDPQIYGLGTDYELQVTKTGSCVADLYEEDDVVGDATPLIVGGAAQAHTVCPAGELDWASFSASAGVTYTVETHNLGPVADTILCLYNAAGSNELICDDDSGPGNGSRLVWHAQDSGTYTLRVRDGDPTVAGPQTSYELHVFAGLCNADAFESDDTRDQANSIPTDGVAQTHNTCPAGNADWVYFDAAAGSYVIETADLGPDADTVIELYDAAGNRLAINDDYSSGAESRIHHTFTSAGTYYVKVRQYNPAVSGTGTEYSLSTYAGDPPTPTPSPTPPPTVTPSPTPPPSGVETIILVHRGRVADLYGETQATALIDKLDELAAHDAVNGEVVRLDQNGTISAAYADWVAGLAHVDRANRVAAAIRGVIMAYLDQHDRVEHVVLVGDDRLLPFRRVADNTPNVRFLERTYNQIDTDHPTGAALRANYFLSDDYYVDREPTPFHGRWLHIPDLAVGRLIETPDEIIGLIDTFLTNPTISVGSGGSPILVTGYDLVQDTATSVCQSWRGEVGASNIDCTLISEDWGCDDLLDRQVRGDPPFKLQSINGHANHYREGCPALGQSIDASEIAAATSDLSGGLIYTLGCHSGLNVPPDNSQGSLDLPQAFAQNQANYVANTGYGWGFRGSIGLSERLMVLYTEELREGTNTLGQALATAKQRYCQERQGLNGYDEKILEESIFYGLPMYSLTIEGSARSAASNPFPSVEVVAALPLPAFGDSPIISGAVDIDLVGALGPGDIMNQVVISDGVYYDLDGHIHTASGTPIQPLLYADVTVSDFDLRSYLFLGGNYEVLDGFDPVIASPVNDYLTQTTEADFQAPGWYPPVPASVQSETDRAHLVTQMGQYDPATDQARLYSSMDLDLYYSASTDYEPPEVLVSQGLCNPGSGTVHLKVGATDISGVERVVAAYTDGRGQWDSVDLSFDISWDKWTGSFSGDADSRYFIQALDGAGNVTYVTEKGTFFTPVVDVTYSVYLPLVVQE